MKQALIDPNASVQHIASWTPPTPTTPAEPVYETYPNSARVAEVADAQFPVAPPLFWTQCADDVVADQWYYDMANASFNPVVNAPCPAEYLPDQSQPTIQGTQTL
jgi:hypothetical protein